MQKEKKTKSFHAVFVNMCVTFCFLFKDMINILFIQICK